MREKEGLAPFFAQAEKVPVSLLGGGDLVGSVSLKLWVLGLIGWLAVGAAGFRPCAAQPHYPAPEFQSMAPAAKKPSIAKSFSSSIKKGMDKLSRVFVLKPPVKRAIKPINDPIALSSKAKASAKLRVAVAQLHEEAGNYSKAAEQYEKALRLQPDHLGALLGFARLNDRRGLVDDAERLYRRAVRLHPNDASVYNNLALFHAKNGKFNESVAALKRAIRLEPKNPKYRNNIATVLVEMGRNNDAFEQLRSVHDTAVTYYNLGYLLEKKGQIQAAARHFKVAARLDPSLVQARDKLAKIQNKTDPAAVHVLRPPAGTRLSSRSGPPATGQTLQQPPLSLQPTPRAPLRSALATAPQATPRASLPSATATSPTARPAPLRNTWQPKPDVRRNPIRSRQDAQAVEGYAPGPPTGQAPPTAPMPMRLPSVFKHRSPLR